MSNEGKFHDPIPKIRAAGKVTTFKDESAAVCVKPALDPRVSTPEHLKKYRKSFNEQPGVRQIHYGIVNDPKREEKFVYGKKTADSEHVPTTIRCPPMSKLAEYANDLHEAKYASHKREPLGKPMPRGYVMPEKVAQEEFRFGVATVGSESAKQVLFPENGEKHEAPEVAAQYLRTHGDFAPGQQKERGYNWPVDKTNHRFGYVEDREINGAAKCVQPERFETSFPQTKVLQKTVEDYIEVTKDELGKPKNLGQSGDPNKVFGAKIKRPGEDEAWNAALCIYGDPATKAEIEPDKDLGKCTKANCTNTVRHPEDSSRVFGLPTIRSDIPKKEKRSIADHQNYGNEPGAVELLFPSSYLEFGVTEEDFNAPRTKDEIKVIFENIGFKYKIGKFNAMFERAKQYGQDGNVSVSTFLEAVKELHFVEQGGDI